MKSSLTQEHLKVVRKRLLQMHYESGVGHIGGNLSSLDVMLLLFHDFIESKDCFVLSKGHAAGALYISLWSKGIISDEELKTFHKDGTKLPGHPPSIASSDIPFATGSLGHGLGLAAGTAFAKRIQGDDGKVFCLLSDGECQEGSTWEALIFIAHHQLSNLTVLIDHNQLQGFGTTGEIASLEPLAEKLKMLNFEHFQVSGHDLDALYKVLVRSAKLPKLIVMKTIKGKGVHFMEHKMEWHYLPLKEAQYTQAIQEIDQS